MQYTILCVPFTVLAELNKMKSSLKTSWNNVFKLFNSSKYISWDYTGGSILYCSYIFIFPVSRGYSFQCVCLSSYDVSRGHLGENGQVKSIF